MAYTTIDDPSAYFQTALYSGNGGGTNNVVNDGNSDLQPDWVWVKERDATSSHALTNSTVGANKILSSNNTNEESSASAFTSFDSDGFTVGSDGKTNEISKTYVGWQWKANGGTTTTNDASSTGVGNTDSVYQANTTAGFSIVTWTGPSGSDARTMAHGLGGTPELIIYKNRDEVFNWYVGTSAITFNFNTDYLQLNTTIAKATDAGGTVFNSAPTSTVIGGANSSASAKENIKYVAYCFRSIQGYSKIGSYTGNGNADGTFIYTGFKPAWFMLKAIDDSGRNWIIHDSKLAPTNVAENELIANLTDAEVDNSRLDILSNGIKLRSTSLASNKVNINYIYMAFAEHPFVGSDGVPTTAR